MPDLGDFAPDQTLYGVDEVELAEGASPARAEHLNADLPARLIALDDAGVAAICFERRAHLVQGLLDPAAHVSCFYHPPDYTRAFLASSEATDRRELGSRINATRREGHDTRKLALRKDRYGQYERCADAPRHRRPRARRHGVPPIGFPRAGPGDLPARGRRIRQGVPGHLLDGVRPGEEGRPGGRGALLRRARRHEPCPRTKERWPGPSRRDRSPPRKARRRQLPGRRAAVLGRRLRRRATRPRPNGEARRRSLREPAAPEDRKGDLLRREDPESC